MTDKVQKIREEVERLQNELIQEKENGFGSDADDACILELQNVLTYIDSLQEEPLSKELEEASKRYATEGDEISGLYIIDEEANAFKAGAKWQKEQTMAKAIDAELYSDGMLTPLIKVKDKEKISNIKFGDKVKLIIIKEDKMNKEEFEKLAKPLNEWLQKNGHPHMQIIISFDGAEVVEGKMGVPFDILD